MFEKCSFVASFTIDQCIFHRKMMDLTLHNDCTSKKQMFVTKKQLLIIIFLPKK